MNPSRSALAAAPPSVDRVLLVVCPRAFSLACVSSLSLSSSSHLCRVVWTVQDDATVADMYVHESRLETNFCPHALNHTFNTSHTRRTNTQHGKEGQGERTIHDERMCSVTTTTATATTTVTSRHTHHSYTSTHDSNSADHPDSSISRLSITRVIVTFLFFILH